MRFNKLGLFLLLGILSLLMVACSDKTNDEGSAKDNASKGGDSEEATFTGGDLHIALNTQPPTLDVHMGTTVATRDSARPVFETLVTLNSNYEVKPLLAERFEQSDDGLEITFYLREGVKFHNGKEMKADDVVASLERWIGKSGRAKNTIGEGKFEALNDYTVKLTLPEPSVGVMHVLGAPTQAGGIMPKEVVEKAGEDPISEFIGTGPYKFVEWKQDQYIKYERNEDYQSPEGTPDGLAGKREVLVDNLYIDFIVDGSTRTAGITTGQYDIGIAMPLDSYEQLESTKSVTNEVALASGMSFIFNEKEGVFKDPAMRLALNMALNKEEILLAGFTSPEFYRLSPGIMFPEQADWHTKAGEENYNPNDPEKAKKMFEDAGYKGETITILTTRDYEYMYNTAIVVKAQLEKIGVKSELDVVDWATLLDTRNDPSKWDALISTFSTVTDPTQHLIFDPKYAGWNEDEKTAELIGKIRTSPTPADAFPYWEELQKHTWTTHMPYVRIGDFYTLFTYTEDVVGFDQFEGVIPWNVGKK